MPRMRQTVVGGDVVAMFVADLHLTLNPPVARSAELNWLAAQERSLFQLRELWHRLKHPALFYAGDIFDRWNVPPELINFALERLPKGYGIPGNHEMPYHDPKQLRKSPYWTLVEAGVIQNMDDESSNIIPIDANGVTVCGFGYGAKLRPAPLGDGIRVAMVHRYIWTKETGHPQAQDEDRAYSVAEELREHGYHIGIFGDNHKPFGVNREGVKVVNCGAFIRRKSDERDYVPSIVLLRANGNVATIERVMLTDAEDVWTESPQVKTQERDHDAAIDFVQSLKTEADSSVSFREALRRYMEANDLDEGTKTVLHRIMEHAQA